MRSSDRLEMLGKPNLEILEQASPIALLISATWSV
jgi:hypothetical protein